MNIGESIKLVRSIAGLTQEQMAARLDISTNYLSLIENGKSKPSLAVLERIQAEFDVPVSFLLWNAQFQTKQQDAEISERYRKLGESMTELATTLIRRKMRAS